MMRSGSVCGISLCAWVIFVSAVASGVSDDPPTTALGGPQVQAEVRPSLIERGFDGRIRVLEISPERAALALLAMDEATRTQVEAILDARSAIFDRVLVENLDLLVQFESARASGSVSRQLSLVRRFVRELEPLRQRGSLRDEIASVLPADLRDRFGALIDEYEGALREQARRDAVARGERFRPLVYRVRRNLERLGQDIAASYERAVASRVAELESFLARAGLSPSSEREVRRILTEFGQRTLLRPTAADKRRLVRDLWEAVPAEERSRLLRALMSVGDLP